MKKTSTISTLLVLLFLLSQTPHEVGAKICDLATEVRCFSDRPCVDMCANLGYRVGFCEFRGFEPRLCICRNIDC
ncbi:hypothetical protein M569_10705 [Genlisea aurea]|uniref:Knottin scorpion toxin-like domain-containing protein n=1 Tax=Genlisea aurea TaxID=192259 RepID=S8DM62_9LAMI|nr:hypothetical protein M569_10705 [Genlisea aurea]